MPYLQLQSMPIEKRRSIYKKLGVEMLNQETTVERAGKQFVFRSEMLKRNFTKRQHAIIQFIYKLSIFCNKERALIPKIMDFELCGVSKTHATLELEKLENMNVIKWYRDTNEFEIVSPCGWEAPFNAGYNHDRARELFILNLKHAGVEVERIIRESLD